MSKRAFGSAFLSGAPDDDPAAANGSGVPPQQYLHVKPNKPNTFADSSSRYHVPGRWPAADDAVAIRDTLAFALITSMFETFGNWVRYPSRLFLHYFGRRNIKAIPVVGGNGSVKKRFIDVGPADSALQTPSSVRARVNSPRRRAIPTTASSSTRKVKPASSYSTLPLVANQVLQDGYAVESPAQSDLSTSSIDMSLQNAWQSILPMPATNVSTEKPPLWPQNLNARLSVAAAATADSKAPPIADKIVAAQAEQERFAVLALLEESRHRVLRTGRGRGNKSRALHLQQSSPKPVSSPAALTDVTPARRMVTKSQVHRALAKAERDQHIPETETSPIESINASIAQASEMGQTSSAPYNIDDEHARAALEITYSDVSQAPDKGKEPFNNIDEHERAAPANNHDENTQAPDTGKESLNNIDEHAQAALANKHEESAQASDIGKESPAPFHIYEDTRNDVEDEHQDVSHASFESDVDGPSRILESEDIPEVSPSVSSAKVNSFKTTAPATPSPMRRFKDGVRVAFATSSSANVTATDASQNVQQASSLAPQDGPFVPGVFALQPPLTSKPSPYGVNCHMLNTLAAIAPPDRPSRFIRPYNVDPYRLRAIAPVRLGTMYEKAGIAPRNLLPPTNRYSEDGLLLPPGSIFHPELNGAATTKSDDKDVLSHHTENSMPLSADLLHYTDNGIPLSSDLPHYTEMTFSAPADSIYYPGPPGYASVAADHYGSTLPHPETVVPLPTGSEVPRVQEWVDDYPFEYANDLSNLPDASPPAIRKKKAVKFNRHAEFKSFYSEAKAEETLNTSLHSILSIDSPVKKASARVEDGQNSTKHDTASTTVTEHKPAVQVETDAADQPEDNTISDEELLRMFHDKLDEEEEFFKELFPSQELVDDYQKTVNLPPTPAASPPTVKDLVSPLTEKERAQLEDTAASTYNGRLPSKVLVEKKQLTAKDFGTILPQLFGGRDIAWLNDEIVNEYLNILVTEKKHEAGHEHKRGGGPAPPVHAFTSFFFTNLLKDGGVTSVGRWAGKVNLGGAQYLEADLLLYPICDANHWRLLAVKPRERSIEYFDSFGNDGKKYVDEFLKYLKAELGSLWDGDEWSVEKIQRSTMQINYKDCGVFTLLNALILLRGEDPKRLIATDGMDDARERIVMTVLAGRPTTEFE